MGCTPRHNTVDVPTLFWAAIPGNEGGFSRRGKFLHVPRSGARVCFNEETNYRSSLVALRHQDVATAGERHPHSPGHLGLPDEKRMSSRNRNKFGHRAVRGRGKSFILTNHLVRQYWEQGAHIVLVDTGNSYQGLCSLIRQQDQRSGRGVFHLSPRMPPSPSTPSMSKTECTTSRSANRSRRCC